MRRVSVFAFVSCLMAAPAFAQETPSFDVSGGYSFLRDQEVEENFHGWVASVTGNLSPLLGITGEIGGNYKTVDVIGTDVSLSVHSFLVGPRLAARTNPAFTPFVHVLDGAARGSASVLGQSESATDFALQPGGGVDFWVRENVGVRAGADYRRVFSEGEGSNEFRFQLGIVLAVPR